MTEEIQTPEDMNPVMLNREIAAMPDEEREMAAEGTRASIYESAGRDINEFMKEVRTHLQNKLKSSKEERDDRRFCERLDRSRARVNNRARVWTDATGKITEWSKDQHLELGFTQGWSAQAAKTAAANMNRILFDQSERFFMYSSIGKRQENRGLKDSLTDLQDYLFKRGQFKEVGRRAMNALPTEGTVALRFDMYKPFRVVRDPETGEFVEERGDLIPAYMKWPLEYVYLTDWDKPRACDQEGVFWVTRNTTLQSLLPNKATFDFNTNGVNPSIRLKSGRFVNLEALEEAESKFINNSRSTLNVGVNDVGVYRNSVSSFPQFDLVEYEGALPMARWVEDRKFTWEMAMFFGLDVGVAKFDPDDDRARREFGRRLNQITHYQFSWVEPDHTQCAGGHTIEFAPSRWLEPSNSLFLFQYDIDGDEALGNSVTDLIYKLEDIGDALRNAQVRIVQNNARPPKLISKRHLMKSSLEEVQRCWEPDAMVEIKGNPDVQKIFEMVLLPEPHNLEQAIAMLKLEAEVTSGITQAAKTGQSTGGTATEANLEEQKSQTKMEDAAIRAITELFRLVDFQTKQTYNHLGREGFIDLIKKISGRSADEVDEMIGPTDKVWNEFDVIFPPTFGRDKTVIAESLRRDFQTFGTFDPVKTSKIVGQLSGYPHVEELITVGYEPIDIEEEQRQMAMGNYVKPVFDQSNPIDLIQRFMAHTKMLQEALAGRVMYPEENVTAMIYGLETYLRQASVLLGGMQALQGMMGPQGSAPRPGVNEPGVPANQMQAATQMSNQARPQFGGSQGNLVGVPA